MPWASTYVVTNIVTSDTTCGGRAHFTRACSMFRFWFVSACGVAIRVGTQRKSLRPACVVQLAPQAGALRGTIANPGFARTTPRSFFASNATRPHWRRRFSCLHQVPIHALKEKAKLYVEQGLIRQEMAERVVKVIESERGDSFVVNDVQPGDVPDAAAGGGDSLSTRLSPEQMQALLEKRVEMMKEGHVGNGAAVTDQYRVFSEIVAGLEQGRPLRLMVQASAGTGTLSLPMTAVGVIAIMMAIRQ